MPPAYAHRLVVIGWTGTKVAYLDVSRDEAIRRAVESGVIRATDLPNIEAHNLIREIEFNDAFGVYSAWEADRYDGKAAAQPLSP